jgi:hypothetical protein
LSKKILELAQKQKLITNKVILRMRNVFRDEAFRELRSYEEARQVKGQENPLSGLQPGTKAYINAMNQ